MQSWKLLADDGAFIWKLTVLGSGCLEDLQSTQRRMKQICVLEKVQQNEEAQY